MKKLLLSMLLIVTSTSMFAQLKVYTDGKVTIQTSNNSMPSMLTVGDGNYYYPGYNMGIYTKNYPNSSDRHIGVRADANSPTPHDYGRAMGVFGVAGNAKSGYNYGVVGAISGSNNGAGIYGSYENVIDYVPGTYAGYFRGNTYVTGTLTAGNVVTPSDIRLKTNIELLSNQESALDNVLRLNVITYNYKEREIAKEVRDTAKTSTINALTATNKLLTQKNHYGLSAQELQKIYPNLVEEGQDGYLGVNYVELVPILIRSIQELQAEIDALQGSSGHPVALAPSATTVSEAVFRGNKLYQNTPNPAKEQTIIRYQLADNAQNAAICIFDMQGKMVKRLPISSADGQVTIGGYELTEGLYLYSLVVNGQEVDTKKMIISK